MVGVAQLVRAPDCGSGSRRFESAHPPFGKARSRTLPFPHDDQKRDPSAKSKTCLAEGSDDPCHSQMAAPRWIPIPNAGLHSFQPNSKARYKTPLTVGEDIP